MLRVIVEVEGGIATPRLPPESEGEVEVMVIDYDDEGMEDDRLTDLGDGNMAYVSICLQPMTQEAFDQLWEKATKGWR